VLLIRAFVAPEELLSESGSVDLKYMLRFFNVAH
jgi:hypothetical protein